MDNPKGFISYSHSDKEFAYKLAEDLNNSGINIWIDTWEIIPGDSLIEKIFMEGLENTDCILVLLSNSSVKSKWVQKELNAAIIKKIEDETRIVPIILEPVDIPLPLRSLFWINMESNYVDGLRELVKTFYGVSDKPQIGEVPEYITSLKRNVGGLSKSASTIGSIIMEKREDKGGTEKSYHAPELHSLVPFMSIEDFNDAIEEMVDYRLFKTLNYAGTHPYDFGILTPTYRLLMLFKSEGLTYDPDQDIKSVAAAIVATKQTKGEGLREITKLSPLRINHAVAYLEDHGLIEVMNVLGTAPYDFGIIDATRHTRDFVRRNNS